MNTLSDRMRPNLAGLDVGVGQVLLWPPVNLLSLLSDLTKRDPHAIIAIDVDPDRPAHVSRAELWRRTLQLRADLATAGVGRGDAVLVCLPNSSAWLDWHVAAASLGAHVVGLPPHCEAAEVTQVLQRARPRVAALPHGLPGSRLPELLREATTGGLAPPAVAVVAGPHGEPPVDPSGYDVGGGAWLPSAATAGMPMPVTSGDELAVAFAPSLAAHLESSLVRLAVDSARAIGLRHDDVLVCAEPLSSPLGLGAALAAVAGEATCLFEPTLEAANLLAALSRFAATHLAAGGESVSRLARKWHDTARPPKAPESWRWLGVALDTPDMAEFAHRVEEELGVTVSGLYGSAEVLSPVALWPPDSAAPRRWSAGGLPVSRDIEVRVVDPDSGRPLPPGETGELRFRGYCVVDHYLGEQAGPARRVTEDGWLATGERGALLGHGEFRRDGRIAAAARD